MKLTTDTLKFRYSQKASEWVCYFNVPQANADELTKIVSKEGLKAIEIKQHREKRSITANSYMHVLIAELAKILTIPKGDLYVKMIKRYGSFTQFAIKQEAVTELIKQWDDANTSVEHTESLCEVTNSFMSKNVRWVEVTCHFGSSGYDKLTFSKLLQGIISECDLVGVNVMTPNEINGLMANYKEGS